MLPISYRKLSDSGYERPKKTITDTMQTKKDIEEQLRNFEEIPDEDLNFVNINTQLKYISYDKKNKKEQFRFGGLLLKVNRDYLTLVGKEGLRFSVQRYTKNEKGENLHKTRFFKKMKEEEVLKEQLDITVEQSNEIIQKQNDIIKKQAEELKALKKMINK